MRFYLRVPTQHDLCFYKNIRHRHTQRHSLVRTHGKDVKPRGVASGGINPTDLWSWIPSSKIDLILPPTLWFFVMKALAEQHTRNPQALIHIFCSLTFTLSNDSECSSAWARAIATFPKPPGWLWHSLSHQVPVFTGIIALQRISDF